MGASERDGEWLRRSGPSLRAQEDEDRLARELEEKRAEEERVKRELEVGGEV